MKPLVERLNGWIPLWARWTPASVTVVAFACVLVFAQQTVRSVQGTVTDRQGNALIGAVVQIEDTRSLRIRSFIIRGDGTYHFRRLSFDVDYKMTARYRHVWGRAKILSAFDSREEAIINLKLDVQKED